MRLLFVFTVDWQKEIVDYGRGLVPAHRLFGYAELKENGHDPFVCTAPPAVKRWLRKPILWRLYQAFFACACQKGTDCIFAVNEASALPVLLLKRLGMLDTPVIVFNTGLMHPRNRAGLRRWLWGWLLPCSEAVVSQTRMEFESVWREFHLLEERQFFIPMLVDVSFFKPAEDYAAGGYCLAAGTNEGRDYPTLLKAFPKNEKLIIVTDAYNAAIIEKHRPSDLEVRVLQALPILQLKALYQGAKLVINPLLDIDYCSGHTVLLENMALGKPVIIASVRGMWDYVTDGQTAITYKPQDVEDLREKLQHYLNDPEKYASVRKRSVEWVRRFSTEEFAKKLIAVAERVVSRRQEGVRTRQMRPIRARNGGVGSRRELQ